MTTVPEPTPITLPAPLVITLGNLKGGVGKTTSAFFIAAYFAIHRGLRVLVIDADPLSQSGYSWFQKMVRAGVTWPFELITFPSVHVGDCIRDNALSGEYDVIVVDTGGERDNILKAAIRESHELVIVSATSEAELERIPPTYKAAGEAARDITREGGVRVRVLLTKVPPNPNSIELRQAREDLADAGYDVFAGSVRNWQWYRGAVGSPNPLKDLCEYQVIGDELVAEYAEQAA